MACADIVDLKNVDELSAEVDKSLVDPKQPENPVAAAVVSSDEPGAGEKNAQEGKKELVVKIDGEDWIDVVPPVNPAVPDAPVKSTAGEDSPGLKEKSEPGEPTIGEEEVKPKELPKRVIEKKEDEEDTGLSRFLPSMFRLKKKMRKKQVEGADTTTKASVVKFSADKAYERQFDVAVAHHEFDDNKPEQVLDLCLIMDCTGSMSSWIEHCKETLHKVIDATVARDPECKVRTAFVGYRDFSDQSSLFSIHDFSYDAEAVKKFIFGVQAKGGGDWPEDVQGGLRKALDLSWSSLDDSVKLAVFIADAPAHGKKYYAGHKHDDFPEGNPAGLTLEDMMKEMSDREILVSLYQLNNDNETMYDIMKKAHAQGAEKEGVEYVDMRDIKPAQRSVSKRYAGRRKKKSSSMHVGAAASSSRYDRLEVGGDDSMRRAYSERTSYTIESQCRKMRSSYRSASNKKRKSGW